MSARDRILRFLETHPDKHYTPRQVAHYLRLTERTAKKHLHALVALNVAHKLEDGTSQSSP